jgi:hypothetical protein
MDRQLTVQESRHQIGPALSRLRRRTSGGRGDLTRNLVLNLVPEAPGEMTVGGVAAEMGVTQPVASRTVAACIADGLLRRTASQEPAGDSPQASANSEAVHRGCPTRTV